MFAEYIFSGGTIRIHDCIFHIFNSKWNSTLFKISSIVKFKIHHVQSAHEDDNISQKLHFIYATISTQNLAVSKPCVLGCITRAMLKLFPLLTKGIRVVGKYKSENTQGNILSIKTSGPPPLNPSILTIGCLYNSL